MNSLSIILLLAFIVSCFGNETKLLNDLKKKYRTISLKYHPDKQNYSKDISNILFAEVSNIYEMFIESVKLHMKDCDDNKYKKLEKEYNNLEIVKRYNSLEKKYKELDKLYNKLIEEYNNLVEDYNFKNSENNDLQNNIHQQNNEYIHLQNEYNILTYKYNKLVHKYNYGRR